MSPPETETGDGEWAAKDGTEDVDVRMGALMAAEPEVATDGGREP